MSRRGKNMVAMTKEDMWCMAPFIGYGFVKPSKEWLEAKHRDSLGINRGARKKAVQSTPHFEVDEYMGIISASLEDCPFEPDIFMLYCDPYQLTHLLLAKDCIDGEGITCTLSGHNACILSVVPSLKNRKCSITSPCRGDRSIAMAQNNIKISGSKGQSSKEAEIPYLRRKDNIPDNLKIYRRSYFEK